MGWSIGYDENLKRDVGYGVPAHCDHPGCRRVINRGLAYVCGGDVYGGDKGCGMHFCYKHLLLGETQLCERCFHEKKAFRPKPDHKSWIRFKLRDESWGVWREKNPSKVKSMRRALAKKGA